MEQYFIVYSVIVETPTEMGGDNVVALSVFSLYLVQYRPHDLPALILA